MVQVYRADGTTGRFRADDELSGEDVLPGFRCKVDDLFPKPSEAEAQGLTTANPASLSAFAEHRIGWRIRRRNSINSGNRHMPHPHDTTEDYPPREPTTVNGSRPTASFPGNA